MASDPKVIESLDALHVEVDGLRTELAGTIRDLAQVTAALEAERELVQLLAPSGPSCPVQVAETRGRIVARLARERAFVAQVEALVANAGNEAS
jgi:ABC-type transporter Mla subunit MlaD